MLTFKKKMIKGILDIITSEPCKTRPALQSMRIKRDGFAYITNGYIAVRYKFDTEVVPVDENQDEFVIPASELLYWYHNAKASDSLNELSILDLSLKTTEDAKPYPDVSMLFKNGVWSEEKEQDHRFDVKILDQFIKCCDCSVIDLRYCGDYKYYVLPADSDIKIDGIMMGVKR